MTDTSNFFSMSNATLLQFHWTFLLPNIINAWGRNQLGVNLTVLPEKYKVIFGFIFSAFQFHRRYFVKTLVYSKSWSLVTLNCLLESFATSLLFLPSFLHCALPVPTVQHSIIDYLSYPKPQVTRNYARKVVIQRSNEVQKLRPYTTELCDPWAVKGTINSCPSQANFKAKWNHRSLFPQPGHMSLCWHRVMVFHLAASFYICLLLQYIIFNFEYI